MSLLAAKSSIVRKSMIELSIGNYALFGFKPQSVQFLILPLNRDRIFVLALPFSSV